MTTPAFAAPRPRRDPDGVAFHALVAAFIVATQFIYTPARDLGPDNTWHYRWARDIVQGVPIFQAGLDGNRIFPDLLFAVASYALSGGALFTQWLPYFYCLFFLSVHLSLAGLALSLFERAQERRAFVLLGVAGLWLFELVAPFWPRWIFDPGNHGTGLPVTLACLGLVFLMNRQRGFGLRGLGGFDLRPSGLASAAAFILLAALVVGSNRFLLLAFLIPLVVALTVAFANRWRIERAWVAHADRPRPDAEARPLLPLVLMAVAACLAALLAYKVLGALTWHKGTTYMDVQAVNRNFSLTWAAEKLAIEAADFWRYVSTQSWQVVVGPLLGLATVAASLALLARSATRGLRSAFEENRLIFGLFAAGSALLSSAFVVWGWEENGDWRYRYLAMTTAFSVVFLASLAPARLPALGRPGLATLATLLALVVATTALTETRERRQRAEREAQFQGDVGAVKAWLETQTDRRPLRGLGEYWAVMDVTARTDLRTDLLGDTARAHFYNTNAGRLCLGGYSFILHKVQSNAPRRHEIIALLGEPRATRTFRLEGHGQVEIMVFDPDILQSRIVDEGKARARTLFPSFCA